MLRIRCIRFMLRIQLYHESTTIALLEMAMFQKAATLGVGDALLDLADYCARAITYLNGLDVAGAFLDKHDGGGGEGNGAKRVVELLESDEQAVCCMC